nr:unnamed protein product [Digitaria exilis]
MAITRSGHDASGSNANQQGPEGQQQPPPPPLPQQPPTWQQLYATQTEILRNLQHQQQMMQQQMLQQGGQRAPQPQNQILFHKILYQLYILLAFMPETSPDAAEKNGTLLRSAGCVGSHIRSSLFTRSFKHFVGGAPALLLRSNRSLLMLLRRRFFAFSSLWTGALMDTGREQAKRVAVCVLSKKPAPSTHACRGCDAASRALVAEPFEYADDSVLEEQVQQQFSEEGKYNTDHPCYLYTD